MCGGLVIPPVKEKRRNSEKRKEKSRDAARSRRSKESEIFHELASELPVPRTIQLDKTSVMRLTVGFLKFRHMLEVFNPQHKRTLSVASHDSSSAEVLQGFLLILTDEGNMIFLSENVHKYLGITQAEMMGQSIYEFTHPCDHDEVKAMLTIKKDDDRSVPEPASFFIRMKSTVKPPKGRNLNMKSSSYQVIHCIGHKVDGLLTKHCGNCPAFYLISIAEPVPHPAQIENPLDKQIFFSRHSPDMKFTDVDDKVQEFLGYSNSELVGKSVYSFYHASDTAAIENCYKTLFHKGQCETGYYRFLAKYGGHVWLLTQATIIYDNSTKPECVVCLNYVLSETENEGQIISSEQVKASKENEKAEASVDIGSDTTKVAKPVVTVSSTKAIFTPKEEGMNKDYLNFPDADLLLFQETTKDSKLPLELEFLEDDPCSTNSVQDNPFISYRDDSLSPGYCGTPDSSVLQSSSSGGSPDHFSTTPSTPDSCSLSDIPNLDPIDEFANLDLKLTMSPSGLDKECDPYEEINFDSRAPYISMNMDDDFPLISPSNAVMWGPQEPIPKRASDDCLPGAMIQQQPVHSTKTKTTNESASKSSLAALLQSDVKKQPFHRHEKAKSSSHRDLLLHKKHQNSVSTDGNNRNSGLTKVLGNIGLQKQSSPVLSGANTGSNGHIVMLDTLPSKKQLPPSKSSHCHRKNGHNMTASFLNNHSPAPPPLGSHTATVKVNDRLIKVQVSVSELPAVSMEQKSPNSSSDSPPKRLSPSLPGPTESPKRLKVDNSGAMCAGVPATDSVLLNLLISGEDASRGYLSSSSRFPENQCKPPVLSLLAPMQNSCNSINDPLQESVLLASESELLDSFLNISQYDADVNAPIQTSHLLQGEDLLDALDLPPSLRDIPTLV